MRLRMLSLLASCLMPALALGDAPMARDGNGAILGFFTGIFEHAGVTVVSPLGFRFVVMRETGWVRGPLDDTTEHVFYENFNCTGQAYFDRGPQYRGVMVPIRGGNNFSLQALYYTSQTAVQASVTLTSRLDAGANGGLACVAITPRSITAIAAQINDPAVTGVPNTDLVAPITVSRNDLYRDGFEASLQPRPAWFEHVC